MSIAQQSHILLVDDNLLDARATMRATTKLERPSTVHHLTDGAAALSYLLDRPEAMRVPDLVLLDLNLPGISGLEVLRWMMSDSFVEDIPAAILTTSNHEMDIRRAGELGAAAYLVKPLELDGWSDVIATLDRLLAA